jgi:hypothetical protein
MKIDVPVTTKVDSRTQLMPNGEIRVKFDPASVMHPAPMVRGDTHLAKLDDFTVLPAEKFHAPPTFKSKEHGANTVLPNQGAAQIPTYLDEKFEPVIDRARKIQMPFNTATGQYGGGLSKSGAQSTVSRYENDPDALVWNEVKAKSGIATGMPLRSEETIDGDVIISREIRGSDGVATGAQQIRGKDGKITHVIDNSVRIDRNPNVDPNVSLRGSDGKIINLIDNTRREHVGIVDANIKMRGDTHLDPDGKVNKEYTDSQRIVECGIYVRQPTTGKVVLVHDKSVLSGPSNISNYIQVFDHSGKQIKREEIGRLINYQIAGASHQLYGSNGKIISTKDLTALVKYLSSFTGQEQIRGDVGKISRTVDHTQEAGIGAVSSGFEIAGEPGKITRTVDHTQEAGIGAVSSGFEIAGEPGKITRTVDHSQESRSGLMAGDAFICSPDGKIIRVHNDERKNINPIAGIAHSTNSFFKFLQTKLVDFTTVVSANISEAMVKLSGPSVKYEHIERAPIAKLVHSGGSQVNPMTSRVKVSRVTNTTAKAPNPTKTESRDNFKAGGKVLLKQKSASKQMMYASVLPSTVPLPPNFITM